ncbi:MAG: FAD-binding oxidoreductase [Phormidesmis sp. RL_2_1]|nr:FAD-binding oxidoreductase [Phormidesmis sp. RL_2_1]
MVKEPKIVIVGCGVVGAVIAYELSGQLAANIVVVDQHRPAQGATGAALGVLMGVISSKVKGRTWRLREASIRRYSSLIAELTAQGYTVPFNPQGIVSLCFDEAQLLRWKMLQVKRQAQGWPLEIWPTEMIQKRCPQVDIQNTQEAQMTAVKAAIYSPADGQVHPTELTHAFIQAAAARGVTFCWQTKVTQLTMQAQHCTGMQTSQGYLAADWVVVAAGLGSAAITQIAHEPLALMPVLGQAMEIQLPAALGDENFQPVINGNDIHLVPLGKGRYWLGATVEFPPETWAAGDILAAEAEGLIRLKKGAEQFISAIAQAEIVKTWSGLRPRPVGQPAPVIKPLDNTDNITLATGHYRNGVLLAPATAQQICQQLREQGVKEKTSEKYRWCQPKDS